MSASARPGLPAGPWVVVGLARSGVAAALALRARGERVVGVDSGAPAGLDELAAAGVQVRTGVQGVESLEGAGALVKSPGVPREAPVVAAARARGLPVLGELELGWRLLDNELVAVTGTNGKTTTVELIGHLHRTAGLPVAVAGNVGRALSGLVGRVERRATVVCEVSSFQLEDASAFAPQAAVLLNVAPDHLDRHGTLEDYARAKLRIFARQRPRDVAVVPFERGTWDPRGLSGELAARRVRFGADPSAELSRRADGELLWRGEPLLAEGELSLRGAHNVENAMAAAAVCLARGVDVAAVREGLRTFPGVPHRLEEVARREGVLFVNDSKATNVASTVVALAAFAPIGSSGGAPGVAADTGSRPDGPAPGEGASRRVHLILGGQSKGQDFGPLRGAVGRACAGVYLIGEDAPAIGAALAGVGVPVRGCGDLERALARASAAARTGEVVLLSPACASFDQFADYEARGERFRELVASLRSDSA